MKNQFFYAAIAVLTLGTAHSQFIDLASFSSSDYAIEASVTTAPHTQNSSGINFAPSVSLGDTLGGSWNASPFDWSSYNVDDFAIKMTITGTNPNLPFSLIIFDTDINFMNFTGTTVGAATDSYIPLTFINAEAPGILSSVFGVQFTWDGDDNVNATLQEVAAVPEPSTYALLALGALALGGYAARRRVRK